MKIPVTKNTLYRAFSLFYVFFVSGIPCLKGATVWTGSGGDTDFENVLNWSFGVPGAGNDGSVHGAFNVTYSSNSAMNDMEVVFGDAAGSSPTVTGANLDLLDSILWLDDATDFAVTGRLRLGYLDQIGTSTLNIANTSHLEVTGNAYLGHLQQSFVNQSDSAIVTIGLDMDLGRLISAADSEYVMAGGVLDVAQRIRVLHSSEFHLDGGSVDADENFLLHDAGSLLDMTSGTLDIGTDLTANTSSGINISGGVVNIADDLNVNTGSIDIQGGDISVVDIFLINNGGSGSMTGGTLDVDDRFQVTGAGSSFSLNSSGFVTRDLRVRDNATFTQISGAITVERDARVITSGVFTQNDDVTVGRDLRVETMGVWNANAGTLTVDRNLNLRADDSTFEQNGADVIIDNRLQINSGTGSEYILNNGKLEVEDRIVVTTGNILTWSNGGILDVHSSASTIDFNGDLTAGAGSILNLDTDSEYLDISGAFSIIDLTIDGYDLDLASKRLIGSVVTGCHLLVDAGSLSGASNITYQFSGFDGSQLIAMGDSFDALTEDVYWYDTTGNEVQICWSLSAIPEPSTIVLLSFSILGMLNYRTRTSHYSFE